MGLPANLTQAQIDGYRRIIRSYEERIEEAIAMITELSNQAVSIEIDIRNHQEQPGTVSANQLNRATALIGRYGNLITQNQTNRNQS